MVTKILWVAAWGVVVFFLLAGVVAFTNAIGGEPMVQDTIWSHYVFRTLDTSVYRVEELGPTHKIISIVCGTDTAVSAEVWYDQPYQSTETLNRLQQAESKVQELQQLLQKLDSLKGTP